MELDPKDYDVVKLLTTLKNANDAYPADLFNSRRQNYIRRVAEVGVGLGVAAGLESTVKSGNAGGFSSTVGGLLETALIIAIVAEASTAAYFYRDKISEIIQSYSSNPQVLEVTSPPEFSSPLPELIITEVPEITETSITTETPTGTVVVATTSVADDTNDAGNNQVISTPDPNGNNGNHFGQTPRPDRPKGPDNTGNNNGDGKGNNR